MNTRAAVCVFACFAGLTLLKGCGKGDSGAPSPSASGSSAPAAALTAAPSGAMTGADLENIRSGFQACFASASRGTYAGADLSVACASMPVAAGYLHQGRNRAQEFDGVLRSEEHTSELQSRRDLVCRLLLE